MQYYRPLLLSAIIFCLVACTNKSLVNNSTQSTTVSKNDNNKVPSRYQLYYEYNNRDILVIYDGSNSTLQDRFQHLTTAFQKSLSTEAQERFNLTFKKANQTTEADRKGKILYLVGKFRNESLIDELEHQISFRLEDDSFSFNKQEYTDDEILAIHNYPNPRQSSLPLTLITGNDDAAILAAFEARLESEINFLWNSYDFSVEGNNTKIIGSFDRQWQLHPDQLFEFNTSIEPVVSNRYVDIYSQNPELSLEALAALGESIEKTVGNIQKFVGTKQLLQKFKYYIYPDAESKALQLGNSTQAHFDLTNNSVHTIINDKYKDNYIEKENHLILRQLLGVPNNEILELGLAISFTDQWQKHGFEYWVARLAESDNTLSLTELMNAETLQFESPLIKECMAGALANFLLDKYGRSSFIGKYRKWDPTKSALREMESDWQAYLRSMVKKYPRKEILVNKALDLRGFNFAHEGYRIFNGYLSGLATQSIEKQADLGCNAVAIVPYSYMRDDQKPTPLPITNRPGSENDQGVIHSAYESKIRGMKTMLKPQIWLRGSWPGDIKMNNDSDWKQFYKNYHRWIRHYALLAEIHQIDMLCVGVEFVKSTLAHEDEWRGIFKNLRGLYSGQLTYAANWGDEFEKVQFWDELDFIGLNCYYPLSKKDNASKAELSKNFESVKKKIAKVYDKHHKPIVFTEIGFRSIDAPWKHPHAAGDDTYNDIHQDRCYQIILEGVQNEDWYGGILWWKFPSYLTYGGDANNSYTPNNKLAEKTIRKWFSIDEVN